MNVMARKLHPTEVSADQDPRWLAVLARDASADGKFVFSVRSTGVYCRPSCPSRHAKPENVRFHPTGEDARRAGFRPCKRCRPDQPARSEQHAATVAEVCRFIEEADEAPRLADLARRAGLSTFHFHRVFKTVTGLTPKAYADAHRARRVRDELARAGHERDSGDLWSGLQLERQVL